MRTVVKDSKEVYHLWAHEAQTEARNGRSSVSFLNDRAYSYSAVIGRIVKSPVTGQNVYLLSNRQYSVTTSSHQSMCSQACYGLGPRFSVYDPGASPSTILKELTDALPGMALKVKRARQNRDWAVKSLHSAIRDAQEFGRLFNLPTDGIPQPEGEELADAVAAIERAEKLARAAEKERQAQARIDAQEAIARWQAGENVSIPRNIDTAYLRLVENGEQVQTSKGAYVPIEHIRQAAPIVLALLREGREYRRNGHTIHLGHYALDRIDTHGNVYAGCHTFERAEIERFAALL